MSQFSLFLGLGTFAGLLLVGWRAPQKELTRYLDAGLGILLGALGGGRALTVAAGWSYYQSHVGEILQVWLGGMSGVGALAGGMFALVIISLLFKFPLGILADAFLPLAGTLTVAAWLGCWLIGVAYGAASKAWWALPGRDEWGVIDKRLPVQLLGAIFSLVIIILLEGLGKRLPGRGMSYALGIFGLSSIILILSFFRADPALALYGLRLETWGAMILMIISALIVVVLLLRRTGRLHKSLKG